MIIRASALALLLGLNVCVGDETVGAYGAADKTWVLSELDDAPFPARATAEFPEPGRMTGSAPCNSYTAEMSAPYPWFEVGPIAATRKACPDLQPESRFFTALTEMDQVEVVGDVLILSNVAGRKMVFKAAE